MPRAEVIFHGRVQGVGFRATTADCAARFAVTGWVRNEPNGTVRMVVDGAPEEIDGLIEAIERARAGFVDAVDRRVIPRDERLTRFEIRR